VRSKPVEDEVRLYVESQSADGKSTVLTLVPMPPGIDLKNPKHRNKKSIEHAVESTLEKGGPAIAIYGGKKLAVHFVGKTFVFNVKVEEVKVVKVAVSKG